MLRLVSLSKVGEFKTTHNDNFHMIFKYLIDL